MKHPQRSSLLEVILDLGRRPEARFLGMAGGEYLRDAEVCIYQLECDEPFLAEYCHGPEYRASNLIAPALLDIRLLYPWQGISGWR